MKFIKSKLIQKEEGRKQAKYLLTLEVTERDLLMMEDLALTYVPFNYDQFASKKFPHKFIERKVGIEVLDFTDKYRKWTMNMFRQFCRLWHEYD